jgi:hypothetical protein
LPAAVSENQHGYLGNFLEQREANTSAFCGSVFDILRFSSVTGEGCSSEWCWIVGTLRVGLIATRPTVTARSDAGHRVRRINT